MWVEWLAVVFGKVGGGVIDAGGVCLIVRVFLGIDVVSLKSDDGRFRGGCGRSVDGSVLW